MFDLLITREVPEAVLAQAGRKYRVRRLGLLGAFAPEILLANVAGVAAILGTPADRFDAGLIAKLPGSVRVIATFSVGTDHIDLEAAAARNITVCNTPEVLSVAYQLILGISVGVIMPTSLVATQNAAERRDVGVATGMLLFLRSMGGAFGSTLVGASWPAGCRCMSI